MPSPYALARGEPVAAFLFSHPLRARLPRGTRNKILWVVGTGPKAAPLRITGHVATNPRRVAHWRGDANGGSGQIQRSLLQFPAPGCWRLTLRWGSHTAQLDVHVRPRRD